MGRVLVGALGGAMSYQNYLKTFAYPLHSVRVNSPLISSGLKIFSASLVSVVSVQDITILPEDTVTVRVAVLGRESGSSIMVLASCIPSLELEQDSLLQPDVQGECEVEMLNMGEGDVVIRKDTVLATADILEESSNYKRK